MDLVVASVVLAEEMSRSEEVVEYWPCRWRFRALHVPDTDDQNSRLEIALASVYWKRDVAGRGHCLAVVGLKSDDGMGWDIEGLAGTVVDAGAGAHQIERIGRMGGLFESEVEYFLIAAAQVFAVDVWLLQNDPEAGMELVYEPQSRRCWVGNP